MDVGSVMILEMAMAVKAIEVMDLQENIILFCFAVSFLFANICG